MDWHSAVKVKATKVRSRGREEEVVIELSDQRLYASGVFGNVYQANMGGPNPRQVAIKKTWPKRPSENREIPILCQLRHPNIVRLLYHYKNEINQEVCLGLIFEFMPITIFKYQRDQLAQGRPFYALEVKLWAYQMFLAIAYLHWKQLCHRDIKPNNLLLNPDTGTVKLADFGSAKFIRSPRQENSTYQVTRYYRAPELILENKRYGLPIDMWAAGCVFGQMLKGGRTLLRGKDSKDQLLCIINILGTPTMEQILAMNPNHEPINLPNLPPKPWKRLIPNGPDQALDLLSKILLYDPEKRLTAEESSKHEYFDQLRQENTRLDNGKLLPLTKMQRDCLMSNESTSTSDESTSSSSPSSTVKTNEHESDADRTQPP